MAASYRAAMVEQVGELERENARLKQRVDSIQGRPATQRELLEMEATRVRYDDAFRDLSLGGAPAPLRNESAKGFRLRLLSDLQPLSKRWKGTSAAGFGAMAPAALDQVEAEVLRDVQAVIDSATQGDFRNPAVLRRVEH
jgi:hypothetical protein